VGPQGPPGATGPQGPPGAAGLSGIWNYKTTAGVADPGTGNLAPDVVGAPTILCFSTHTTGGTDARNLFLTTQVGDVLLAQQQTDSTKWGKFQVRAAPVDHSTWFEVPVTVLANGTGGALANNADVVVDFNRSGTTSPGIPVGGTTGQQLTKASGTDYDTAWTTDPQQLTGTGAPAVGTGNAGDFYIDTSTSTMYGPKVGVSFGSPESVLGTGAPPTIGGGPYLEGNRLRVLVAGQIAQLRYYAWSAGVARKVTLWRNSDQTKLGEVSHTAPAVGWQTVTLTSPVVVAANTDVTVSLDPTNDIYGPIAPSLSANITWLSGAYGTTGSGVYPPSNDPNDMYWVDIVFQAGTTPWPVAMQPGGAPTLAYRHVQSSAATTWSITHNLSFRPNVSAVDSTGREIWPGATDYTSATTVQLTFSAAVGGEAYLS